jgi:hypothetical protein
MIWKITEVSRDYRCIDLMMNDLTYEKKAASKQALCQKKI